MTVAKDFLSETSTDNTTSACFSCQWRTKECMESKRRSWGPNWKTPHKIIFDSDCVDSRGVWSKKSCSPDQICGTASWPIVGGHNWTTIVNQHNVYWILFALWLVKACHTDCCSMRSKFFLRETVFSFSKTQTRKENSTSRWWTSYISSANI